MGKVTDRLINFENGSSIRFVKTGQPKFEGGDVSIFCGQRFGKTTARGKPKKPPTA